MKLEQIARTKNGKVFEAYHKNAFVGLVYEHGGRKVWLKQDGEIK